MYLFAKKVRPQKGLTFAYSHGMYKRVCRSFRLTDEEYQILKPLIEAVRMRTDASNKQHLEYLNN